MLYRDQAFVKTLRVARYSKLDVEIVLPPSLKIQRSHRGSNGRFSPSILKMGYWPMDSSR